MSIGSASLALDRSSPLASSLTNMLDSAAEQLMVNKDFQAAFDTCARGLESLARMELEENR